jgi:hypothetical protein
VFELESGCVESIEAEVLKVAALEVCVTLYLMFVVVILSGIRPHGVLVCAAILPVIIRILEYVMYKYSVPSSLS